MVAILFDVTRLLLRGPRASPTGIDRVSLAYGRWLLERRDLDLTPVWGLGGALSPMPARAFARMIQAAMPCAPREPRQRGPSRAWRRLARALACPLGSAEALRPVRRPGDMVAAGAWGIGTARRSLDLIGRLTPSPGAIYLNVSHFGLENPNLLKRLAARRVRPAVMVHDLIPILHPEFCAPGGAERHARRIRGALAHAGLIVANSQSTADDVLDYARSHDLGAPPIVVAPLGVEAAFQRRPEAVASSAPYFVCVGTIEPRKNLAFLLTVWRRLAERLGGDAPRLVVVGRRGWENEAVIDHLQRSPPILRLVHEVCDLQDEELARLVAGATALLAPSLAEGFDFATIEALALGTPVIASRIPAHCEMARGGRFVDPLDGLGWLDAIESALREPRRGPPFSPPTWDDHFRIVEDALNLGRA